VMRTSLSGGILVVFASLIDLSFGESSLRFSNEIFRG
jgi:hypothetical protein